MRRGNTYYACWNGCRWKLLRGMDYDAPYHGDPSGADAAIWVASDTGERIVDYAPHVPDVAQGRIAPLTAADARWTRRASAWSDRQPPLS